MDVLDPASLLQGLGVVQSLSFLEGLQRLYTAELGALGPSNGELSTQGGLSSTVFEIDDQGQRREVINLPGEDLSKIVPFRARDGQEYLLMAGRASGQIIRLNPVTAATQTVADGLDACTGIIYLSLQAEGRVVAFDRSDGSITEIAAGLGGPGHLLGTFRLGVSDCFQSFNLIIVEETADQLSLAIPSQDTVITPWVPAEDPLDLTLLPPSPFTAETSVLFNQVPAGGDLETNEVAAVEVGDLYEEEAVNPPLMIAAADTTGAPGPDLVVGATSGAAGNAVDTSIFFRPGEEDGNVLLFTLDCDQSRLTFDSSDAGADRIPDGVIPNLAGDFLVFVLHNATPDGELGFLVVDAEAPFAPIPEQDLFDLNFTIQAGASGTAFLLLTTPGPQLIDLLMALQALDDVVSGGISIVP